MTKSQEIDDLIDACGGRAAVKLASKRSHRPITDISTVGQWTKIGIPERHWPLIMRLTDITPAELHEMNERLRRRKRRAKKKPATKRRAKRSEASPACA